MEPSLRKLSDHELLENTKTLVARERELLTSILWHLNEVSNRRLYSARGYSSLFEYAVKELQYSEAAAWRRINAMRLLQQVPEVAPAIENGSLNLSQVSLVQNFLKREETDQGKVYSQEEKRDLLQSMAHKSKRECELTLASLSPESVIQPERVRPVTETKTELRIVVTGETLKKIERLRDLLAHQNPTGSYGKLLDLISEMALDKVDPVRKEDRAQKRKARKQEESQSAAPRNEAVRKGSETSPAKEVPASKQEELSASPAKAQGLMPEAANREDFQNRLKTSPAKSEMPTSELSRDRNLGPSPAKEVNPRAISESLKRLVYIRDEGHCTFQDPETKRVCGSTYKLQVDHIIPVVAGGQSTLENLQLRCASHNQWEGVVKLGKAVMGSYIFVK